MDYFKHYATASMSNTINHLFDEFGHQGYACWFLLLELCSENWDGETDPKFNFHSRIVRQKLRLSSRKVQLFLEKCSTLGALSFRFSEKNIEIDLPKLLEVKTTRKVIKSNKKQSRVYKEKEKEIDKEEDKETSTGLDDFGTIDEFSRNEQIVKFLSPVKKSTQILWVKKYSDPEWILSEIEKAFNWVSYEADPEKKPRCLSKFLGRWLSRADKPSQSLPPGDLKTRPNFSLIKTAVYSGASKLSECKTDLGELEIDWIRENGGLLQLSRIPEKDLIFKFRRLNFA